MPKLDDVQILSSFGLTLNQSKIILALANSGPCTVQKISQYTNIARETVYRVLPQLFERGFVIKSLTKPVIYMNAPLDYVVAILLEMKTKQICELRNLKRIFLKNFNKPSTKNSVKKIATNKTLFIPQNKPIILETQKLIKKASMSLKILASREKVTNALFFFEKELNRAMARNVRIKIVTEKSEDEELKSNVKIRHNLINNPLPEVRCASGQMPAHFVLIDEKHVIINMDKGRTEFTKSHSILSTTPCLVDLTQKYFDLMWHNAEKEQVYVTE